MTGEIALREVHVTSATSSYYLSSPKHGIDKVLVRTKKEMKKISVLKNDFKMLCTSTTVNALERNYFHPFKNFISVKNTTDLLKNTELTLFRMQYVTLEEQCPLVDSGI